MAPGNRKNPINNPASDSEYTLMDFMREFPDDDACLEYLWRTRYADDGVHAACPKCETERSFKKYATSQQRQSWTCTACGWHIHPTAGTIFHKSSTSLQLWFYAMYLMSSTRAGISAKQIERELGVTYKTAWRMAKEIRQKLMVQDEEPMTGPVEADETYIGGKAINRHKSKRDGVPGRGAKGKTVVAGIVQRKGSVIAKVVPNAKAETLMLSIATHVMPRSTVFTDEWSGYKHLGKAGYHHERVHHGQGVYVSGTAHTNTIEGFWSLVKRGISGVYHVASAKHLQGYLNEYAWRYNHREDDRATFVTLLLRAALR